MITKRLLQLNRFIFSDTFFRVNRFLTNLAACYFLNFKLTSWSWIRKDFNFLAMIYIHVIFLLAKVTMKVKTHATIKRVVLIFLQYLSAGGLHYCLCNPHFDIFISLIFFTYAFIIVSRPISEHVSLSLHASKVCYWTLNTHSS